MQVVKVGLVMMAGLGSTWAARTVTDAWLGRPAGAYLAQAAAAENPPAAAGGSAAPAAAVPPLSREEMEEELRRASAQLAGKPAGADLEEFRPSRPLAADIAIALPSDM